MDSADVCCIVRCEIVQQFWQMGCCIFPAGVSQPPPEPADWLGLSSLGSPDSTARDAAPLGRDALDKSPASAAGGRDGGRQVEPAAAARGGLRADRGEVRRGSTFDEKAETGALAFTYFLGRNAMQTRRCVRPVATGVNQMCLHVCVFAGCIVWHVHPSRHETGHFGDGSFQRISTARY